MLNSRMFRRLQKIVACGSFAKAADSLFITRSALVQQIKAVEEDLGFRIFERSPKGVSLTEAGKLFMEEGNNVFAEYEELLKKCKNSADQETKVVTIGITPSMRSVVFPKICKAYKSYRPDVEINFKVFLPQDYYQAFMEGEFDVAAEYLFEICNKSPNVQSLPIPPCGFCLFVQNSNPLSMLTRVGFQDLRGKNVLLLYRGVSDSFDKLRDHLEAHEPEIHIIDVNFANSEILIKCDVENAVLISLSCQHFIFPDANFTGLCTDWNFTIKRGICYHKNCSKTVKDFLRIAEWVIKNSVFEDDSSCCSK